MITVTWTEHQDASERVLRWFIINGKMPKHVTIRGIAFTEPEYRDALKRVQNWINKEKKYPKTVRYGAENTKTPYLRSFEMQ